MFPQRTVDIFALLCLGGFALLLFAGCIADAALYQINLESFDTFSDVGTDFIDPGSIRMKRQGRNHFVIDGNFTLQKNVGDEVVSKCIVTKRAISGKETKVMENSKPLCQQIEGDDTYYPNIAEVANFPVPAPCPYPKGDYYINNYEVTEDQLPAMLPDGVYVIEEKLDLDGVVIFGFTLVMEVKR